MAVLDHQPAARLEHFIPILEDVGFRALNIDLDEVRQDAMLQTPDTQGRRHDVYRLAMFVDGVSTQVPGLTRQAERQAARGAPERRLVGEDPALQGVHRSVSQQHLEGFRDGLERNDGRLLESIREEDRVDPDVGPDIEDGLDPVAPLTPERGLLLGDPKVLGPRAVVPGQKSPWVRLSRTTGAAPLKFDSHALNTSIICSPVTSANVPMSR